MYSSFPDTLIAEAFSRAPIIFAFDFGRYLIAACLVSATVWALRRSPISARKIQAREATWTDKRREIWASAQTCGVYVVMSLFVIWGVKHGWMQRHETSVSWGVDIATMVGMLIVHDAYFYWSHRAMHHPRLFKTFHRFHHRTITPTPFAAYSFAIPEAVVMAIFMPIWLAIVPTSVWVIVVFLNIMILRNCIGHAGFELHPRWWLSSPFTRWISTTTHHDLHHAGSFNHNFGFYFTYWDKLMATEHPEYNARFAEVTGRERTRTPAPTPEDLAVS